MVVRKLLSIAHSYVIALNRRLAHEMSYVGKDRWEVTAVAPDYFHGKQDIRPAPFEPAENEPCRVEMVPARLSRHVHIFHYSGRLRKILNEGWDLVHAWEEPYIFAGGQIALWTPRGIPLVFRTAQSLNKEYPPPFRWIEPYSIKRAAGWICSGTLVEKNLLQRPGYAERPHIRAPLGVDTGVFNPDRAGGLEALRILNWAADGPPVIGYLGRFVPDKGLPMLMAAMDAIKSPWRALFLGGGPLEGEMKTWAAKHGDRVRIAIVKHNEVPRYLNAMNIMVCPSQTMPNWKEQFGRMLVEAFAVGLPVIGSDSGEIPHVIGSTGLVVGEKDTAGWTAAMDLLLGDGKRREQFGTEGLERTHREFAWPIVARQYLDFFDELVSSSSTRQARLRQVTK